MHPTLNISQTGLYLYCVLGKFKTSGATYPGVPHFGNIYLNY